MLKNFLVVHLLPNTGNKDKIFLALNFLIPIFMGIYIFANPLPLSSINEICFYLSFTALITLLFFQKTDFTLRSPLTLPFALFSLWAVLGLFFALDIKNTLHDLRGYLLEYLIVFYLLVNYFSTQKKLEILSLISIISATIFSIGAVISYYLIDGHPFSERLGLTFQVMPTSLIGYITIFAAILAVRHFHRYKTIAYKILFCVCFLVNIAATILTQTRSSLIGLFAGLAILCFANKKNLVLILTIILLVVFMPGMGNRIQQLGFTKDIRSKMNRLSLEIIKEHPIGGIGFGMETYGNKDLVSLETYNKRLPPEHQQQGVIISAPHNTFLDIAIRTGIVGLILFLYILLTAVWMLWKILRLNKDEYFRSWTMYLFAGFVSFVLPSFFADTTFGPRAVVFYSILAMISILWRLGSQAHHHIAESG